MPSSGQEHVPARPPSQVDSSVGGKTGVNHPLGKNMIGAFYQPRCVLIDTDSLNTLPDRELASGISGAGPRPAGAVGSAGGRVQRMPPPVGGRQIFFACFAFCHAAWLTVIGSATGSLPAPASLLMALSRKLAMSVRRLSLLVQKSSSMG